MTELEALRTFYRYNSRVRRNYLEALLRLPKAERLKDRGASYPSLQEIFVHTLDGIRWWLDAVRHDQVAQYEPRKAPAMTPKQLREEAVKTERLALTYLNSLAESDLAADMVCHFDNDGKSIEARFPVADVLWHVVEEELQHRGELNALLWQMDVEPPIAQAEDWKASKALRGRA
ncbi:MAG: DinB family protein [Thermoplasmata archaeon]|nr:DinB family protein [Thermoplasmata archaeon]